MNKAEEIYSDILSQITALHQLPMSMDNWCSACAILAKAFKVAGIVKEPDVSVLPFFKPGLTYLTHAPKEVSLDSILDTLDDASEFYSFEEQLVVVRAFSQMMDQFESWAETIDLSHGRYWRGREGVKPWNKENLEEAGCEPPPYYGWVLVNVNRIKNHFDPPVEPYATELNNNPYNDRLFTYQTTRSAWRFSSEFIETLMRQATKTASDNPLVGKYLAWGAKSPEDIPSWCLKIRDGQVSRELFERNLKVTANNLSELLERLNANAKSYYDGKEKQLRDLVDECFTGAMYQSKSPVKALEDKLDEVNKGLESGYLRCDGPSWHPVLAEALKLPRYRIYYFDWASMYEDEGPDEPGLMFTLEDGSKCEVHYNTTESKWWSSMDVVEYKVGNIIDACKYWVNQLNIPAVYSEWLEIDALWKSCCGAETSYHCFGDTYHFAEAFCHGLLKVSGILEDLQVKSRLNEEPEKPKTSAFTDEDKDDIARRTMAMILERPIPAIVDGYSKEGRKEAVQIANTKMSEKDWFSDPNLAILFGSHPNTIANWRKKPEMAPAGFADAWSAKDIRRMSQVAHLYKANRERADVMNTKGVKRNMSEEQIHNERLK